MKIRLTGKFENLIQTDSIVDGEGIRTVVWTQGCLHNCPGCHNPSTHSFTDGILVDVEDVKNKLKEVKGQDGITLSGGDPFFQVAASLEIASYAKSIGLNVWAYSGFTFEELLKMSEKNHLIINLLKTIDVLVDGKFKIELKSYDLMYRGSSNQRIIDVQKSLKQNKVIIKDYQKETYYSPYQSSKYVYI